MKYLREKNFVIFFFFVIMLISKVFGIFDILVILLNIEFYRVILCVLNFFFLDFLKSGGFFSGFVYFIFFNYF